MAANSMGGLSPAGADLGLGDLLAQQVTGETEEQRKKRMTELQQKQQLGATGSMAVTSLGLGGPYAGA
jgi:hypothetical protein